MKLSALYGQEENDHSLPQDGAVAYDLLISAEGTNSRLRDLVDVEGAPFDQDFGVKWFTVTTAALDAEYIHRWLHKAHAGSTQTPLVTAFPMVPNGGGRSGEVLDGPLSQMQRPVGKIVNADGSVEDALPVDHIPRSKFAVMAYMRIDDLNRIATPEEFLKVYMSDVLSNDSNATITSESKYVVPAPTIHCENLVNSVGLPNSVMIGDAAHHCHPFWMQNLAIALEDAGFLINQVDGVSKNFYDALSQFSRERGVAGDGLRTITARCLYFQRKKHVNPLLRFRNSARELLFNVIPESYNVGANLHVQSQTGHSLASRSLETMFNGRGYTSYEYAALQQTRHMTLMRPWKLYT